MSTNNSAKEKNIIGKAIKSYRKGIGYTLQEMADDLGTSTGFLSEVERGIKMPGSSLILALKKKYPNLDLNKLFTEYEEERIDLHKLVVKDSIEDYRLNSQNDFEQKIIGLVDRIENGPWSHWAKIELIDKTLKIVEKDIEELRNQSPPDHQ